MDYVRLEIQFFVFQPYMGGRVPRKTESLQAYLIENNPLLIMEQNIGGNFSGAGMTRMSHTCPCPERSVSRYLLYESFEYPVQSCMMLFSHKVQKACRRSQHKVRNRQPRTGSGHVRDSSRVPHQRRTCPGQQPGSVPAAGMSGTAAGFRTDGLFRIDGLFRTAGLFRIDGLFRTDGLFRIRR